LTGTHRGTTDGPAIGWRLFAERQDSAIVRTQWSLAKSMNGHRFVPNIGAREGMYYGASVGSGFSWGADPFGTRLTGSGVIEGATGETSYAKASSDLGLTRGLGRHALGILRASAGTATPGIPVQRLWYLGGPHSVRGHAPGDAIGDTYWFGRAEIAVGQPLVRPSVFGDIGWAGARSNFTKDVKPLSAIGAGAAFLDGLVRFDVARGLDRGRGWRVDFYMEAR